MAGLTRAPPLAACTAAALRERERELLREREARRDEWAAAHPDLPALSEAVDRLRALLRQHGIDPPDESA